MIASSRIRTWICKLTPLAPYRCAMRGIVKNLFHLIIVKSNQASCRTDSHKLLCETANNQLNEYINQLIKYYFGLHLIHQFIHLTKIK